MRELPRSGMPYLSYVLKSLGNSKYTALGFFPGPMESDLCRAWGSVDPGSCYFTKSPPGAFWCHLSMDPCLGTSGVDCLMELVGYI